MSGKVFPLHGNQKLAVDPGESVWLSASAGTGKTQVLSARVLRLLLQQGVQPSQILCLTFTKAGAAEMAVRVNEVLANWVRMSDPALGTDLAAIGADNGPETRARARTLFASVLDCPGGGLRIDTIHAFAQWLLATFPAEAGLTPGSRAMEDRERELLAREVLSEMLLEAQRQGDMETLSAIETMSLLKGPDAVQGWLMQCAAAGDLWFGEGAWQPPLRPRICRALGIASDASAADVAVLCTDAAFDVQSLRACLAANQGWSAKTGQENAAVIADWLAADPPARLERIGDLYAVFHTQAGKLRAWAAQEKVDPGYPGHVARVADSVQRVRDMLALVDLADFLAPALTLGRTFALAWDEAKTREGFVDFDDQIRRAAALLRRSDMADWIRYKLDRRFDHVLIDEAQDTNAEQWAIIHALIDDYFTGEGARDGMMRTVFTVGDYKQAIFRFQGTSPENFEAARQRVKREMAHAADNAADLRDRHQPRRLQEYGLGASFRTSAQVLEFVDAAIDRIGWERFGLKDRAEPHVGQDRPGLVALWPAVGAQADGDDDSGDNSGPGDEPEAGDEGAEGWLSRPDRQLADRIARQVRLWMDNGFPLVKGGHRNAGPGDVMVLVRKRKELAGLIVARLHAAGVPVAGVDRLRLGAPLAVKDLMAAIRFAAQPLDDLNLANLLVSPLIGWSQQQLLDHAWRPKGIALWDHLRASTHADVRATLAGLLELLARADFEPPQALLHWILLGPWQGRRNLVARLGGEANDPIDELLNAAHAYASAHTPSLQGFIQWFDVSDGELKREADSANHMVRVMTVHGSKGLQAPIVILADAAGNPDTSLVRGVTLDDVPPGGGKVRAVPLPGLVKDQKVGPVAAAEARLLREEREEHWRLLYVAMTRAEEALFIAGSLGPRDRGAPAPDSWFAQLAPLFETEPVPDPVWGTRREWGVLPPPVPHGAAGVGEGNPAMPARPALPDWAVQAVGPEPRPPRPLAPSAAGEDESADPPFPPGTRADAARRGVLVHRLLERLPELPEDARVAAGERWLATHAGDVDDAARRAMLDSALAVLAMPEWGRAMASDALAEVPIAATVGGQVIAGTIDRLLVTGDTVTFVDFKTTRRPPEDASTIPLGTLRQMAAYAAALEAIYPGRAVRAAVLYTHAPVLLPIAPEVLAAHKPELQPTQ
ncbi:double-strand break repair helicase AddA [Caenibius tardaugens NBRC 16725]|uniref:DNA 3'-5' helicase n=1 Tax=Caenibius tardaugens NBRC 16725 TaxID=1219035 RepID=U2YJL9_9SPHN|nr:double-strand break repair helicase AddA [Caenibius tardaugens]AZI34855.1 double-strand break repair helicase AddA [Caenibius tardaugens NBRC 16725]GAD48382.1 double-strand break repair helicase AddA [Caenibius tardaugens NBRC 16725]